MDTSAKVLPWRKNPFRKITVEVVIFLYIAGVIIEIPVLQQYLYERAKEDVERSHNITRNDTMNIICNPGYINTSQYSEDQMIQREASKYVFLVNLTLTVPAVIMACILGSWSDKKGRKSLMIVTSVGGALDATIVLFGMYLKLPLYVFMIASSINGLCGYYPTMVLALLGFVADTTPAEGRPLKLGILEALAFISGMIGQFGSGFWITSFGFESPFWAILAVHLVDLVYIVFFLPESLPAELRTQSSFLNWDNIKAAVLVYLKPRARRWMLSVNLLCSFLVLFTTSVVTSLTVLYGKKSPLCWTPHYIGYFQGSLLVSKAIGAVLGIKVCSKLGMSNYTMSQFGSIFLVGNLAMIGLSRTTLEMFLATGVAFFSGIPNPCIRAQMSVMVEEKEQGALFSILASIESLCLFLSSIIFTPIYSWSLGLSSKWEYAPGISFFINAAIAGIPIVLLGIIKCYLPNCKRVPVPGNEQDAPLHNPQIKEISSSIESYGSISKNKD